MRLFSTLATKMSELFSDDCGRLSSMRVATVVMVGAGVYFFWRIIDVWSTVCLARTEFLPLNLTDFTGLLGAVGAMFAKGWQKRTEEKYSSCNEFTFSADEPTSPEETMPMASKPPTDTIQGE